MALGEQLKGADVSFTSQLALSDFDMSVSSKVRRFINQSKKAYGHELDKAINEKDDMLVALKEELGGADELLKFRQTYHSNSLEEILLAKRETNKIEEYQNRFIRKSEPVYKSPEMRMGRAHFLASEKRFMNLYLDTYWFNLIIIFLMTMVFYVILQYDILRKLLTISKALNLKIIYKQSRIHLMNAIRPVIKNR